MFTASADSERELLEFASTLQYSARGTASARRDGLSSQEFYSFSGVGAIVCTVNGQQRMSTAFLVGAFDIAVTVAHTFEDNGAQVARTTVSIPAPIRSARFVSAFRFLHQVPVGSRSRRESDMRRRISRSSA